MAEIIRTNLINEEDPSKYKKGISHVTLDLLDYYADFATKILLDKIYFYEKFHPELKTELVDIVKCKNPRCITSVERGLKHICVLKDKNTAKYRCKYCDSEV